MVNDTCISPVVGSGLASALVTTSPSQAADELRRRGWAPDYFAIRRQLDLKPLEQIDLTGGLQAPPEPQMVVLAAARLGQTRLIDNLEVTFSSPINLAD